MVMRKYTVKDCGEETDLSEMREHLLRMLDTFTSYCDENGFSYYLSGGTMLGAARHKGFIPWDDDIDLNLPRPDLIKIQEVSKGRIGHYLLVPPTPDLPAHSECWRLYDPSLLIGNTFSGASKEMFEPIFIDLFPIEGLPDSFQKTRLHYAKLVMVRKIMDAGIFPFGTGKTLPRKLFHMLLYVPSRLIGAGRLFTRLQRIASKYSFEDSTYVGVMTAPVHTVCERVKKREYVPPKEVLFEGRLLHAPGNYEQYLTQLYGPHYMEMPPEEKRKSHHTFRIFHRKRTNLWK